MRISDGSSDVCSSDLVEQPGRDLVVVGDRRQLVSATYNLLDNAVKYSDAGASVVVRARSVAGSVDVCVQDHGVGIPTRDLERVFERFYRVDRARSEEHTSELQSLMRISYAVFCLKKKTNQIT